MNNEKTMKTSIIKIAAYLLILEIVIISVLFTINGQIYEAINLCIMIFITFFIVYLLVKHSMKTEPNYFENNANRFTITSTFIACVIIVFLFSSSMFNKLSYKIGNIQITFPKEIGFVYGFKDENNKYYYVEYYLDYCSITIQNTHNNGEYSVFENIKNNVKLDNKITNTVRLKDIYNSNFSEGKEIIKGKEWNTYYTQVENINYTIYYLIIDDYIYHIGTANFNENPSICTDKINETFKKIKYNN